MAKGENDSPARERVLLIIACAITLVWCCAVIVQVVAPNHPVPLEVHGIMATVAASFFGGSWLAGRNRE